MTDAITQSTVEDEVAAALDEYEDVDHDVAEIYAVGPGDKFPGESGGVTVTLDGAPDLELEDVEAAAEDVNEVLDGFDLDPQRKRTATAWATGDDEEHPRVEISTAALD